MTYLPVNHRLTTVSLTLQFPGPPDEDGPVYGVASGRSQTRRAPLWQETNSWADGADLRHEPADWLHHIALVALQDRPNSTERLLFGLTGGLGLQDPLF